MAKHPLTFLRLAGLALAMIATEATAQGNNQSLPSVDRPQESSPTMDPSSAPARPAPDSRSNSVRSARASQLLDEFRAILDASASEQNAQTAASDNSSPAGADAPSAGNPTLSPAASNNGQAAAGGAANNPPMVRWPKDPKLDYSGFSCEFFTRPPQAKGTTSSHADGAWIAYGERMYQCVNGRWRLEGPVAAYADGGQRQADQVER